jgi:hypothetical protein
LLATAVIRVRRTDPRFVQFMKLLADTSRQERESMYTLAKVEAVIEAAHISLSKPELHAFLKVCMHVKRAYSARMHWQWHRFSRIHCCTPSSCTLISTHTPLTHARVCIFSYYFTRLQTDILTDKQSYIWSPAFQFKRMVLLLSKSMRLGCMLLSCAGIGLDEPHFICE